MAKAITKAQRNSAIINALKISSGFYEDICQVVDEYETEHEKICNGYMLVRMNNGQIFNAERVTVKKVDLSADENKDKNFILNDNGLLKETITACTDDVTDNIMSFANMVNLFKTTNRRGKFIKYNFHLKDSMGKEYIPIVFRDNQNVLHLFNGNYVYWSLLMVCSSLDTPYIIYVENSKMSKLYVKGDIGCAVVCPMRITEGKEPDVAWENINKGYDKVEKFRTDVIKSVKEKIDFDKFVFDNTVEFYLNNFVSENAIAFYNEYGVNNDEISDEEFSAAVEECIKMLIELYNQTLNTYTKAYQLLQKKGVNMNTKWWSEQIKGKFTTILVSQYMNINEHYSRFCNTYQK